VSLGAAVTTQGAAPLIRDRGAGDGARSLGSDKLLQLAGSLAAKQLARAPDECGREELLLHVHILQARAAPAPQRRRPPRRACARPARWLHERRQAGD